MGATRQAAVAMGMAAATAPEAVALAPEPLVRAVLLMAAPIKPGAAALAGLTYELRTPPKFGPILRTQSGALRRRSRRRACPIRRPYPTRR